MVDLGAIGTVRYLKTLLFFVTKENWEKPLSYIFDVILTVHRR